jgi:ABC transporter substrate binding protein
VLVNGMFFRERKRIAQLAASARLSAVYGFREHVDAGGLISYGVNLADNFRRAATYVVKILKGAKPGDLSVEFPNKLELIINLKTSKALRGRPFADTCQRPLCHKQPFQNRSFCELATGNSRQRPLCALDRAKVFSAIRIFVRNRKRTSSSVCASLISDRHKCVLTETVRSVGGRTRMAPRRQA